MGLPAAIAYHPPIDELPASRATWTIDPTRAALLVHDMQEHFARAFDRTSPAWTGLVDRISSLTEAARQAGVPVVYTAQPGDQQPESRGLLTDLWGPGIAAGPEHESIVEPLRPEPGDTRVVKHRYSAFARTDLEHWLREQGRDQLVICGIYAHIGVLATATDAFGRDIAPFVVADAVADFGRDEHDTALALVARTCGVVLHAEDAVAALEPSRGQAVNDGWAAWLQDQLTTLLADPAAAARAVADPGTDLFALGLDSMRTMSLIDALAEHGVDLDLIDLIGCPTSGFMLETAAMAPAPTR